MPRYLISILVLICTFCTLHLDAKRKHTLAICAIFQDEARFLREWIEFHRLMGVEHFYLYDNRSLDDGKEVLREYIDAKIVELFDWDFKTKDLGQWLKIQCKAYNHALENFARRVHWMAFIDVDEYLFPMECDTLLDFLQAYEDYGGVSVNWQLFGTSGVRRIPADRLLIETLTRKAETEYCENVHVKAIVQPRRVVKFYDDPSLPEYLYPHFQANADCFPTYGPLVHEPRVDKIRIHHYWAGDGEHFSRIKLPRWRLWYPDADFKAKQQRLNAVEDLAIFRFVPALRERLGFDAAKVVE